MERATQVSHDLRRIEALIHAKSSVDCAPPKALSRPPRPAPASRARKEAMVDAAVADIKMIGNIAREMARTPSLSVLDRRGPTSLNADRRRRELRRIDSENAKMLGRLEKTKPAYKKKDQQRSYQESRKHVALGSACKNGDYPMGMLLRMRDGQDEAGNPIDRLGDAISGPSGHREHVIARSRGASPPESPGPRAASPASSAPSRSPSPRPVSNQASHVAGSAVNVARCRLPSVPRSRPSQAPKSRAPESRVPDFLSSKSPEQGKSVPHKRAQTSSPSPVKLPPIVSPSGNSVSSKADPRSPQWHVEIAPEVQRPRSSASGGCASPLIAAAGAKIECASAADDSSEKVASPQKTAAVASGANVENAVVVSDAPEAADRECPGSSPAGSDGFEDEQPIEPLATVISATGYSDDGFDDQEPQPEETVNQDVEVPGAAVTVRSSIASEVDDVKEDVEVEVEEVDEVEEEVEEIVKDEVKDEIHEDESDDVPVEEVKSNNDAPKEDVDEDEEEVEQVKEVVAEPNVGLAPAVGLCSAVATAVAKDCGADDADEEENAYDDDVEESYEEDGFDAESQVDASATANATKPSLTKDDYSSANASLTIGASGEAAQSLEAAEDAADDDVSRASPSNASQASRDIPHRDAEVVSMHDSDSECDN